MTATQRLKPKDRTAQLLDVAATLAIKDGWNSITRQQLADAAGVEPGTVSHRFGTMGEMRRSLMRHAIANEILPIIAQGVAVKDKHAMKAPEALRIKALASLTPQ